MTEAVKDIFPAPGSEVVIDEEESDEEVEGAEDEEESVVMHETWRHLLDTL